MPFLDPALKRRLIDNYKENKDTALVGELSRILIGNPEPPDSATVRDLDLLTQNVANSTFLGGYIPGVLETAYDYCVEALKKTGPSSELYGSFHNRARIFSRRMAEFSDSLDEKTRYLETALSHSDVACVFYENRDKPLFGKALSSRGEIRDAMAQVARDEARVNDEIELRIQSAKDKSDGAAAVEDIQGIHACSRYALAAYQEFEAALLSIEFKVDLLMNAIEHAKKSEALCDFDDEQLTSTRLNLGKYYKTLYDVTQNLEFLDEAGHYYKLAASYCALFSDVEHNKMSTAANSCIREIEMEKRAHKKNIEFPKKKTKKKKPRRESERRIIEQELDDLS
ncbi:Uncharacterised protein [uncultured archaeon]|nr:Uncharacterised protein [uncultured archaeon]